MHEQIRIGPGDKVYITVLHWGRVHNITQLMSYVQGPNCTFENKRVVPYVGIPRLQTRYEVQTPEHRASIEDCCVSREVKKSLNPGYHQHSQWRTTRDTLTLENC